MKRKSLKNILKIGVVLVVAGSLLAGLVLPATAETETETVSIEADGGPVRVVKGTVTSIDLPRLSFDIMTGNEEVLTINTDENTRFFMARLPIIPLQPEVKLPATPGKIKAQLREPENAAKPFSVKEWFINRIPWLKNQQGGQNAPQIQSVERVKNGPVSIKLWPAAQAPRLQEHKQAQEQKWLQKQEQLQEEKLLREQARISAQEGLTEGVPSQGQERGSRLEWLRRYGKPASFGDIKVDDRVVVWLAPGTDGNLAKWVLIIKEPFFRRVKGTVESVSGDSIAITGDNPVTLNWNDQTIFILRGAAAVVPGQPVLAVYNSETLLAKLVRINPGADDLAVAETLAFEALVE